MSFWNKNKKSFDLVMEELDEMKGKFNALEERVFLLENPFKYDVGQSFDIKKNLDFFDGYYPTGKTTIVKRYFKSRRYYKEIVYEVFNEIVKTVYEINQSELNNLIKHNEKN